MEAWFFILIFSLSICVLLKSLFNFLQYKNPKETRKLPPGPPTLPIIGNLLWLRKSLSDLELIIRHLSQKYGPVVTLYIGSNPTIFVTSYELAQQALIQNGAIFASRPPVLEATGIITSKHDINSTPYGSLWRLLRRNLTSEILHSSRVKSYSHARKSVMEILINKLRPQAGSGNAVRVMDHFQYAMFCLLVFMCFGDTLDEKTVREIEAVQRVLLVNFFRFNLLNFFPKILFRKRWRQLLEVRRNQEEVLIPLIRARQELKKVVNQEKSITSYVDTLLDLEELPDEGRKLSEMEMVSLCSEFLTAGTDTTSTVLQWIMARLVKHKDIQAKLFSEINGVVDVGSGEEIKEEDLQRMPYLKAVVLEGLRLHPPGHFTVPHAVTEDTSLDGYVVPKTATVHFLVGEMGWDPKVWEDPMEFRPERFLSGRDGGEVLDVTGRRETKMMPFGAGRRICPGLGLAMLLLEYFVANLVREFEWTAADGHDVDLSEKQEFTVVMKNPLRAHISPSSETSGIVLDFRGPTQMKCNLDYSRHASGAGRLDEALELIDNIVVKKQVLGCFA
ncbi:hypothetical protein HHK36_000839 [Tetracentron sinense]|uniref:Cytochrome P450 n=1 Tax=Tetracentron sinense TaxID=13715 RepID=A0A835A2I4_TETSI|nr:hypothetical protein HHK36_000839 [Tetracentron sinense]